MKLRSILVFSGYVIVFLVSLYFFILFSLPEEQIARYVIDKYLKTNNVNISYKSSGISPGMNLVLKEAEVELSDDGYKFNFEKLEIGFSLLKYLISSKPVYVVASGYGGNIKLVSGFKKENIGIELIVDNLDLSLVDIFKDKTGLNLKGNLDMNLNLSLNKKETNKSNGSISFSLNSTEIKGGKIMGFEVPSVNIGELKSEIDIKNGKLKVSNFKGKGKDLEIKLAGDGQLAQNIGRSSLNLNLKLKPAQVFIEKNEKIKTILFGIGSSLDKEGYYNFSIKGTLSSPSFMPEKKN